MIPHRFTMITRRRQNVGFTIVELLVSIVVLLLIVFMVAQLMSSTAAITRPSNTHVNTDTQARAVFDRMAVDLSQMIKRIDVDYYVKGVSAYQHGNGHAYGKHGQTTQPLNDQMAFF